ASAQNHEPRLDVPLKNGVLGPRMRRVGPLTRGIIWQNHGSPPLSMIAWLAWRNRVGRPTGSGRAGEAAQEEVELAAAIHLALDELQPGHLPFGLPIRPRQRQGRYHRGVVATHEGGDAAELGDATRFCRSQPAVKGGAVPLPYEPPEFLCH